MSANAQPLAAAQALTPGLVPPGLFCRGDEALRITSFNSVAGVTLAIEGLSYVADRGHVAFADRHVPNTDRTSATTILRLAEGWLAEVHVRASAGAPRRGACFVIVELVRGTANGNITPLGVLLQGYVTDSSRRGWPGSPLELSIEGPGLIRSITGTDPAAGVEISETVPTNARWRLYSVLFVLITDATVANRVPVLTLDDGATVYYRMPIGGLIAGSGGATIVAAPHAISPAISGQQNIPLPIGPAHMQGGHRIRTATSLFQAGDNYGAPQLWVEEWIED